MHDGPRQAARHARSRGGQAGLQPRDHQAARPARSGREDPRPGGSPGKGRTEWPVESWGPVGAFIGWTVGPEFWDDQPFILVDYLPLESPDPGRARSRPGSRRSPTSRPRPTMRKPDCEKLAVDPELDRRALIAFVRGSQAAARRPPDDRRARGQAERGPQVAHARGARRGQDHRRRPDGCRSWTGPASSSTSSGNSMPTRNRPSGSPTSRNARSKSPCGCSTYKAYSGERLQTAGLILIMPRPSNAKYLAFTSPAIEEVTRTRARATCRSC